MIDNTGGDDWPEPDSPSTVEDEMTDDRSTEGDGQGRDDSRFPVPEPAGSSGSGDPDEPPNEAGGSGSDGSDRSASSDGGSDTAGSDGGSVGAGFGSSAWTSPPGAQRWFRSEDRIFKGVCGGLAESLALDPVVVRLAFVVLAILDGAGLAAYLAGYLLLADRRGAPSPDGLRRILGWTVAAIGGLAIAGPSVGQSYSSVTVWILLLGVAFALWKPSRRGQAIPPDSQRAAARGGSGLGGGSGGWPAPGAPGWAPPVSGVSGGFVTADGQLPQPVVVPVRQPRKRRSRSPLGRITLAAALAAVAVGASVGGGDPRSMKIACGAAAIICGAGLLVGVFAGHARWLLIPGLLAVGGSATAAAVDGLGVHIGAPWRNAGTTHVQVLRQADVPSIDVGSGSYDLDMTSYRDRTTTVDDSPANESITATAKVGIGKLVARVLDGDRVTVTARVGIGSISVPGATGHGYRRTVTQTFGPEGGRRVNLDLTVGVGEIQVWLNPALLLVSSDPNSGEQVVVPITAGNPEQAFPTIPLPAGVVEIDDTGTRIYENGASVSPTLGISLPDGTQIHPDGSRLLGAGAQVTPDGWLILQDGTRVDPTGNVFFTNGIQILSPTTVPQAPTSTVPRQSDVTTFLTIPTTPSVADPSITSFVTIPVTAAVRPAPGSTSPTGASVAPGTTVVAP